MRAPVWLAIFLAGCAAPPPAPPVAPPPQEPSLHDRLRQGAFQLDAAGTSIEEAVAAGRKLDGPAPEETREAVTRLRELMDEAAATVTEIAEVPPAETAPATLDEQRLRSIEDANDARRTLDEADELAEALAAGSPPPEVGATLNTVRDRLAEASDALAAAVEALGGVSESTS